MQVSPARLAYGAGSRACVGSPFRPGSQTPTAERRGRSAGGGLGGFAGVAEAAATG